MDSIRLNSHDIVVGWCQFLLLMSESVLCDYGNFEILAGMTYTFPDFVKGVFFSIIRLSEFVSEMYLFCFDIDFINSSRLP